MDHAGTGTWCSSGRGSKRASERDGDGGGERSCHVRGSRGFFLRARTAPRIIVYQHAACAWPPPRLDNMMNVLALLFSPGIRSALAESLSFSFARTCYFSAAELRLYFLLFTETFTSSCASCALCASLVPRYF
jgi:hypothetical protein